MDKRKLIRFSFWILNILVVLILVWSLINYKILNQEVSEFVQVGGLLTMIFLVILLEGAPVFVGSSIVVASILTMNTFNPWFILFLFLFFALVGNVFYFYFGYLFGKKIFRYFDKKDIKRYEKLFRKHGRAAMIIMAISPLPYLPTLAGIFKVKSPYLIVEILLIRMIRHTLVFFFWFSFLVRF